MFVPADGAYSNATGVAAARPVDRPENVLTGLLEPKAESPPSAASWSEFRAHARPQPSCTGRLVRPPAVVSGRPAVRSLPQPPSSLAMSSSVYMNIQGEVGQGGGSRTVEVALGRETQLHLPPKAGLPILPPRNGLLEHVQASQRAARRRRLSYSSKRRRPARGP